MAKRRPKWFVPQDPAAVRYGFFISHVGEDASEVKELKSEIQALSGRGGRTPLDCFLDMHDWLSGNDNGDVIRRNLLAAQHMVVWVSPNYLQGLRGWVWFELAYAELIERSLNFGGFSRRQRPYLVSVFRKMTVEQIERTPLVNYWSTKLVRPDENLSIREIAQRLVDFHDQEARKRLAEGG
jgi:hypothetical protein